MKPLRPLLLRLSKRMKYKTELLYCWLVNTETFPKRIVQGGEKICENNRWKSKQTFSRIIFSYTFWRISVIWRRKFLPIFKRLSSTSRTLDCDTRPSVLQWLQCYHWWLHLTFENYHLVFAFQENRHDFFATWKNSSWPFTCWIPTCYVHE